MDVRFVIRSPSGKRRNGVVPLPVLVGRGDEAKIRIPQDSVSRRHCEFVERDGHVCIRDLGSTNGTLLDGKRIRPNVDTPVSSGGTVGVGDVQIRVEYAMPTAEDADRTILLTSVPDMEDEAATGVEPPVIELGAATDETQSDAGEPLEPESMEPEILEAAAVEPSAPLDAVGPADPGAEPAEPDPDDFAFLSAPAPVPPPAAPAKPTPTRKPAAQAAAKKPVSPAAPPAAGSPAKTASTPPVKPAAGPSAKPAAKPAAKPVAKPAAKPAPAAAAPDAAEPAAPPPAADADDFGFLGGPAAPAEQPPAWPAAAEEPAPVDEDDLNDFFKSLS